MQRNIALIVSKHVRRLALRQHGPFKIKTTLHTPSIYCKSYYDLLDRSLRVDYRMCEHGVCRLFKILERCVMGGKNTAPACAGLGLGLWIHRRLTALLPKEVTLHSCTGILLQPPMANRDESIQLLALLTRGPSTLSHNGAFNVGLSLRQRPWQSEN